MTVNKQLKIAFSAFIAINLVNATPLSARETVDNYDGIIEKYDKFELRFKFDSNYSTLRLVQIDVTNYDAEIVIPDEVDGYPVTTIGQWEYQDISEADVDFESQYDFCSIFDTEYTDVFMSYITNIDIPNSVTTIWPKAFDGSSFSSSHPLKFEAVTIPNSVTDIGAYAFQNAAIKEVSIPNSVSRIYQGTFNHCQSLETVIIGNGVTELGQYAFGNTPLLSKIYVDSERVPNVSDNAFPSDCTATVYVPNGFASDYEGVWGKFSQLTFKELNPGQTSDVNAVASSDLHLSILGRVLEAKSSSPIRIFDLYGREILKPTPSIYAVLTPGIYIVYSKNESRKIVIK